MCVYLCLCVDRCMCVSKSICTYGMCFLSVEPDEESQASPLERAPFMVPHYPGAHQEWLATHRGSFVFGSDYKLAPPCLDFSMGAGKGVLDTLQRQLPPCQQPPPRVWFQHTPALICQHYFTNTQHFFLTLQMTEKPN